MGLFKSREEKRMERDMEVKRGIARMKKHLQNLAKSESDWLDKAKRAQSLNSPDQLAFMRKSLKATIVQRRMLERELLTLEAAKQMKDQAESYVTFAESMGAVSKSIAEVYGSTDLSKTQMDFERAITQADSMSQRMDIFLDMTKDSMFSNESSSADSIISDAEIDRMLGADPKRERQKTRAELDSEMAAELGETPPGALDDERKTKDR